MKPLPDPKNLITPFWFGLRTLFGDVYGAKNGHAQTLPNSRVTPGEGVTTVLMIYCLLFQFAYYDLHIGFAWIAAFPSRVEWCLWTVSNATDFGLIVLYLMSIPVGTYYVPFIGRRLFDIEVASALPQWPKLLIHGCFVVAYIAGRVVVLVESIASLRALPAAVYQGVNWSGFLPHI